MAPQNKTETGMPHCAEKIETFIIHLERATKRLPQVDALRQKLKDLPASGRTTILPAIDAQTLPPVKITAVYRRKIFLPFYPFACKAGEIACFLSHRQAWEALLATKAPAAFITEDDMQPQANFSEAFALASANIGEYGLIRFPNRDRETGPLLAQNGKTRLIRPKVIGLGAVSYMINRQAAEKLLTATKQFDRPLDVFLQMFWITGLHSLALVPGGICEISAKLGGSTLTQKHNLWQKLYHELLRPIYRAQISLLSRLKN